MPSSGKLEEIQRGRIQRVIKEHVEEHGEESLVNDPGDSLMYALASLFTKKEERYFDGSLDKMITCIKEYFREKEVSGELAATAKGNGGTMKYSFVGKLKKDLPDRASGSNNRSQPGVYRPTHDIAAGVAA